MTDIVVGVDGSPNSVAALRWAHAKTRRRGDHLVALFPWGFVQPGHAGADHTFDPSYDASRATTVLAAAVEDALGPEAAGIIELRIPHELAPGRCWRPPPMPSCSWWEPVVLVGSTGPSSGR
jgi:hypothetical protein